MVQIANAWAVNRITGEEQEIAARDADPKSKDHDWLCPDECCRIPLNLHRQYTRTFHDPINGQSFIADVAAHFQRKAHGPSHAAECTAVDDYTKYRQYARDERAVSHGADSAFVFNLNIPIDDRPAPTRQRPSALTRYFQQKTHAAEGDAPQIQINQSEQSTKPRSMGLSSVDKLAKLLDLTAFDPDYRESTLLRAGPRVFKLSDVYKDDMVRLYREQHARAKDGGEATPALIHFKPIALAKYHSKRNLTIQGQAAPVLAGSGHRYAVSVMLHCGTQDIFNGLKADIKDGARSFLLYVPSPYVDLMELAQKKRDIEAGVQKDNAVFVHARIGRPEQLVRWTPPDPQMSFHFPLLARPVDSTGSHPSQP